jgi:signal transduction histidine kinase
MCPSINCRRGQGYSPLVAFGVGRPDDFSLILEDDLEIIFEADAVVGSVGYLRSMQRIWQKLWPLAQRYWFDALILTGLCFSIAVVTAGQDEVDAPDGPLWFDIAVSFAFFAPLFFRRRFPFGAPIVAAVAVAASTFVDGRRVPFDFTVLLLGMTVSFLFGALREPRQAIAGFAVLAGVNAIVVRNDPSAGFGDMVWSTIIFGIAWTIGFGLGHKFREADEAKERAERLERAREEEALVAVAEERARIARELHDVVGHSVSVMTVQAAGVRRLLKPDQEREREALQIVEQTGREALAEMRRLVGVLRRPEEAPALAPQPSLEHLDRLVAQAREAGLPVELRVEGEPVQLAAGLDLTAYRFVQEGLTNALKHAGAHRAEVVVRYDNGHVELTVSDDGKGDGGGESGGHGLVGMRERVSVYGGELEAGPRPEGGYRLHARLPLS